MHDKIQCQKSTAKTVKQVAALKYTTAIQNHRILALKETFG